MKYFLLAAFLLLLGCQIAEVKSRDPNIHPSVAESVEIDKPTVNAEVVHLDSMPVEAPLTITSNGNIYPGALTGHFSLDVKKNAIHGERGMIMIKTAPKTVYIAVKVDLGKFADAAERIADKIHNDAAVEAAKLHNDFRLFVGVLIALFVIYIYLKERKQ